MIHLNLPNAQKNYCLQDPDKKPMGHCLKRYSKTRWNSIVDSIQSLIDVRPVVEEVLKYQTLALTESEWDKMNEMVKILAPCKIVVEMLCREDADLLTAEQRKTWSKALP